MSKARVNSRTQPQRVVEAIQKRILDGDLKPGAPLRQIPLSKEHCVSQSVVRESLQTLEQYGLVTGVDKQGFAVRKLGRQELIDAYRVREVLEGLAARLCCRRANRDAGGWLKNMAHQIHAQSEEENGDDRSDLAYQFHQRFLSLSGNEMLQRVSIGYRFVGNLVVTDREPDQLLEEHLAVVEAVANNQPDEAERLARVHVARSADSIVRHEA